MNEDRLHAVLQVCRLLLSQATHPALYFALVLGNDAVIAPVLPTLFCSTDCSFVMPAGVPITVMELLFLCVYAASVRYHLDFVLTRIVTHSDVLVLLKSTGLGWAWVGQVLKNTGLGRGGP